MEYNNHLRLEEPLHAHMRESVESISATSSASDSVVLSLASSPIQISRLIRDFAFLSIPFLEMSSLLRPLSQSVQPHAHMRESMENCGVSIRFSVDISYRVFFLFVYSPILASFCRLVPQFTFLNLRHILRIVISSLQRLNAFAVPSCSRELTA